MKLQFLESDHTENYCINEEEIEEQNNMELVSDYMRDNTLRHALNELTRKTFCFDFESWVTGGYFEGDYIPYSFMENGKIVSNVSANRMTFLQNGVKKNYIQIGTVMTDENYRKQGLAKKLIDHVVKQYHSAVHSSMEQINKFGLQMFCTADMENVYYAKDMDCFIVADMEEDTLLLQSIICESKVTLMDVLSRIGGEYHKCRLGFTPVQDDMYMCVAERYDGSDDYRLFYKDQELESIELEKLYFPELSHA